MLYNRKSRQRLETDERIDVVVDETTLPTEMILEKRDKELYDDWDNNDESFVPSIEYRLKFIKYASLGMITKGNYENIEENGVVFRIFYYMSGIHWLKVGLFLGVWVLIWLFLICLGLMSTGFKLLGGKDAAKMFDVVDNPISGLMIGVLSTVLVQSSSTTTSIIIGLVGADEMSVNTAIPMIMGANIGTSVTNTLVSMGHYGDEDELRRGFAGATVHDCFNLLSVMVLLPIQWATHMFNHITYAIAKNIDACNEEVDECENQEFIQPYLKPYYDDVAKYDKKIAKYVSQGYCDGLCTSKTSEALRTTLKSLICSNDCNAIPGFKNSWLDENSVLKSERVPRYIRMAPNIEYLYKCPYPSNCETSTPFWNTENDTISNIAYMMINNTHTYMNHTIEVCTTMKYDLCDGRLLNGGIFYRDWHLSDNEAGALCVWFSLSGICAVLYLMVQSLNLLIKGSIAKWIKRAISLNGYLSMLMGMFITVMVQSSSITTSVLTPLVAIGLIPLKDMYPLTLGANVGTTITGILSASVVTSNPVAAWQVALTHFFFNIFGIVLWYPLKRTRKVPLRMAVYLGNQTVKYKLFPLVYTGTVFFVIPVVIYGISLSV